MPSRQCPRCKRTTEADFVHCQKCGTALPSPPKAAGGRGGPGNCVCTTTTPSAADPSLCGCCGGKAKPAPAKPAGKLT